MKKFFIILLMAASFSAAAQNIQVHYDLGHSLYSNEEGSRQAMTTTFEKFSSDNLGSWFYFVDLDLKKSGVMGAYTEVSREFNLGTNGIAAHVEYNGGLNVGTMFQSSALLGPAWNGHNDDFSTTYSVQVLYKQFFGQNGYKSFASAQLTGVWSTTFAAGKCTFSGFIDFWRGQKFNGHGQLVMLTEPQLWYNINDKISVGGEVEISNNFIFNPVSSKSFFVNPTFAVKFNL